MIDLYNKQLSVHILILNKIIKTFSKTMKQIENENKKEISDTRKVKDGYNKRNNVYDHDLRFRLYKEMRNFEPRMWTRNHHLIRMATNCFVVNFTIYGIYNIYFNHYDSQVGFAESLFRSHRMKLWLFSIFALGGVLINFNYNVLDTMIYNSYYSEINDKDYYLMYEDLIRSKKMLMK